MYESEKTINRLDEIAELIKDTEGMDEKFLILRIERMKARIAEVKEQRDQANKTADMLDRQLIALTAVMSEEEYLLKEIQADKPFPVATEEEKADMLASRNGLPGVSKAEAIEARTHVLSEEANGFIEDLQTIRGSGQLQRNA